MDKILTIDIGGSKIIVGLADFCGNILQYEKFKLPEKYDIDFLIDKICKISENYMSEKPIVAGVTIPGLADAEKGMWLYAPFSGISNFNICEILGQRLGIKVFCDNDVNACARAERRFGICKSTDNFLWITVSNDIALLDRGIQDALEKYLFVSANKNTVVKKTGLGYLAALLGSAAVAMEGEGYV